MKLKHLIFVKLKKSIHIIFLLKPVSLINRYLLTVGSCCCWMTSSRNTFSCSKKGSYRFQRDKLQFNLKTVC